MQIRFTLFRIILVTLLLSGCGMIESGLNVKTIHASDTFMSDKRSVSGFSAIDMRTFGNVLLSQGSNESVTVEGSDNVVPLIKTRVRDGVLVIETDEPINVTGMKGKTTLTFIIQAIDLKAITVSGLAEVNMDRLSTPTLDLVMSGAGIVKMEGLTTENLKLTLSGAGGMRISGEATTCSIILSGAGGLQAPDLKTRTTSINISGMGGATLWVTGQLDGTISGGGSVSYYGNPFTNTQTTGMGAFKSLGSK
jgi:hypothetical protein